MTAIWHKEGTAWRLVAPSGFPAEASLHQLVEDAPHILPLAGSPNLVVVGREVRLGANWADLIAIEPSGRLALLEIKLAQNAEARRAVVAQILTYAAYLHGMDPTTLERDILGPHLRKREFESLAQAVIANDQEGSFEAEPFAAGLTASLREGRFRLVLVLDEAPPELVRLVGFLGAVSDKLIIDLVTIAAYKIDGSQIVVPQRVDAEQEPEQPAVASHVANYPVEGKDAFMATIDEAPSEQRQLLRRVVNWAAGLEADGLAKLWTYRGETRTTLLPYIPGENAGLVTIWNDNGVYISVWRSVFLRRAPKTLAAMESSPGALKIGRGTTTRDISDALLSDLTAAYREASGVSTGHEPSHGPSEHQRDDRIGENDSGATGEFGAVNGA